LTNKAIDNRVVEQSKMRIIESKHYAFTIYNIHEPFWKGSQGKNYTKPRGAVQIESTQIRWILGQSDRRRALVRGSQRPSKLSLLKGAIRLESTQIIWFF
jgi:hypothetical protein